MPYILKNELRTVLTETGRWPAHSDLRTFMKSSLMLRTGFKGTHYTAWRKGHTCTKPEKLRSILQFLKQQDRDFAMTFLQEDWHDHSDDELFERYIDEVPDDYEPEDQCIDLIGKGPQHAVVELLQMQYVTEGADHLQVDAIPNAADLMTRSIYREIAGVCAPNQSIADRATVEEFAWDSRADLESMLAAFIRYTPGSVCFRKCGRHQGYLTIVAPLTELNYDRLRKGMIDEMEAIEGIAPERSQHIMIYGAHIHLHGASASQSKSLQFQMMTTLLKQLGQFGQPVLRDGLRILTYNGCDKIQNWLKKWCFKPLTEKRMKRSNFELYEQVLGRAPSLIPRATIVWCLVVIYQAVNQITTRANQASGERILPPSNKRAL